MSLTQVVASSSPSPTPPPSAAAAAVHGRLLPNLAAATDKDPSPSPARPRNLPGSDTVSFPNGTLKRHIPSRPRSPPPSPPSPPGLYRECLKNHAASLGGHALDGCGEFMPAPLAVPSDPSSLKCAACGCHRNFHRRDDDPAAGDLTPKRRSSSSASPPRPPPAPPISSPFFTSAPHMLLALSTGAGAAQSPVPIGRKRFRTKFSREQKERMLLFAEKLGWRMQKQEEKLVEDFCDEIGVAKGVLKVWMHNNKHSFVKKDQLQQLLHGNGNGSFNDESPNGFDTNNTNGTTTTTTTTTHVFNGSSSSS